MKLFDISEIILAYVERERESKMNTFKKKLCCVCVTDIVHNKGCSMPLYSTYPFISYNMEEEYCQTLNESKYQHCITYIELYQLYSETID